MKIGTRSVLFGAHQFILHPFFVALAWTRLYGFPLDLRLWVAFFVHDLGYWGKPNMDGPEGETHVEFGARIMARLFGPDWGRFCRYHSRFYAKRDGVMHSRLCIADKLAVAIEPRWLYLPRVILTGEINEYMVNAGGMPGSKYTGEPYSQKYRNMSEVARDHSLSLWEKRRFWFSRMTDYLKSWVNEHKDGREDSWTPRPAALPTMAEIKANPDRILEFYDGCPKCGSKALEALTWKSVGSDSITVGCWECDWWICPPDNIAAANNRAVLDASGVWQ